MGEAESDLKDVELTERSSSTRNRARITATVLVAVLVIGASLLYVWPIVASGGNWGIRDWDQHLFYHAVARDSIAEFGQLPLWNPYYCGGMPLFANPQTRALSPFMAIHLALGAALGIKWDIWLHYVLGLMGGYLLGRKLGLCRAGAAGTGCLFIFSSAYALHLTEGHSWVLPAALIPWMLYSFILSLERVGFALLTGALLAMALIDGGHYVFPIGGLFVATYGLLGVASRRWKRALMVVALTGVATLGFSAIKLLPSMELMRIYPRAGEVVSGFSVEGLYHMTLDPDQRLETVHRYSPNGDLYSGLLGGVAENGMYIGWFGLALALVGLLGKGKRYWRFAICLFLGLWICFGTNLPVSLWRWLHALPGLDQMACAVRFRFVVLACTAVFAGAGITLLRGFLNRVSGRPILGTAFGMLAVGLMFGDLTRTARPILSSAFVIPALEQELERADDDPAENFRSIDRMSCYDPEGYLENYHWFEKSGSEAVPTYATYSAMLPAYIRNEATVRAYEPIPVETFAKAFDHSKYHGEVFLWPPVGEARLVSFSPNRIAVEVRADQDAMLVINQNHYPGWRVVGEGKVRVRKRGGLIAVPVGPGTDRVELVYLPTSFLLGAVVTGVSILATLGWLLWVVAGRRTRARRPQGTMPTNQHLRGTG